MEVDFAAFIPMLTGGGGGILFAGLSKVLMKREDRAEKAENAERQERQILMTVVQTQAENVGYMKAEIDGLKLQAGRLQAQASDLERALENSDLQHTKCREDMARLEARLDRDTDRPPPP